MPTTAQHVPSRQPSASQETPAVRVRGLRRTYGRGADAFDAVRGIDLDVARGSITALLGTNGAGKTSTLEVLEGINRPDGGTVEVLGLDPVGDRARVRRRIGVLLQTSGFSGDLTVEETLRMWAATVTGARPVAEALEMLDLTGRAATRVRSLSGGEVRRLDLACTLLGHPELVMLDEPTTGLDPESRREVWRLVRRLREDGCTVLLTTHYLEEAEALADRLEVMHAGLLVRSGTPAEIAAGHRSTISFRSLDPALGDRLAADLRLPARDVEVGAEAGTTSLRTPDLQPVLTDLLTWCREHDVHLEGLDARTASLEQVFLAIADGSAPA
ncbi:ABC transporter ATP-binding protein [uncultured Pseudokineococcus sp.]|uniref:ABC transporter ATP-binding protein n=1 Tax=uncultured Pseudokineococcus sp. TaxID=1642928 RepID=UPI002631138F|nr:ABC transporter ATP-binding protein [uncultured Pseudokineococcus sp.]